MVTTSYSPPPGVVGAVGVGLQQKLLTILPRFFVKHLIHFPMSGVDITVTFTDGEVTTVKFVVGTV